MATNNQSSGFLIEKDHLKERWALQFLIACVLLAALIFGCNLRHDVYRPLRLYSSALPRRARKPPYLNPPYLSHERSQR